MSGYDYSLRIPVLEDEAWKARASCIGLDTEMFFPEKGKQTDLTLLKMCNQCEVKQECFYYALKYQMEGIWAGTGLKMKRKIVRRQKITPPQG
mgnify:CR=1 FL=1